MSLGHKAISGVRWTGLSTMLGVILQVVQIAILARFLSPKDFGLMAMVMMIVGFAQTFIDMGLSNAIIHKQEITKKQLSTLYWCNVFAGFVIFLLLSCFAPLVTYWYKEPDLLNLIILVSTSFLFQPLGQQFAVLWQKELKFLEISLIEVGGKIVVFVVSILLAYFEFGVYSLVCGSLMGGIFKTVQYVIWGTRTYPIQLYCKPSEITEFLSFGLFQMLEKTVNYFNSQIDALLIGKLFGMEVLGGYNITKQLIMKPLQIVNPIATKVSFPIMSIIKDDRQKLKSVYLKQINLIASVNFSLYVFLGVMATHIVTILYGEKWLHIVEVLQILCFYGALRSIFNPVGSLLLAKGRADLGFYWNVVLLFYMPIVIFFISPFGIVATSWGLVFVMFSFILPIWVVFVKNLCGAGFVEYHRQIIIPALIAFVLGGLLFVIRSYIYVNNNLSKMIIMGCIWLLLVVLLNYFMNRRFIYTIGKILG